MIKDIKIQILVVVIATLTTGFSQNLGVLNESQKKEYFRGKVTIEVKQGSRFGPTTYRNWTAFQGMEKLLNEDEFFTLMGYEPEAEKFSTRRFWKYLGYVLFIVGGSMQTADEQTLFYVLGFFPYYYYHKSPEYVSVDLAEDLAIEYNKNLLNSILSK